VLNSTWMARFCAAVLGSTPSVWEASSLKAGYRAAMVSADTDQAKTGDALCSTLSPSFAAVRSQSRGRRFER